MALSINTNVMSLNAQRNLSTSGAQLATSLQRLSSGLRINSAKDDAAGLAIAERMTTQINGLNQAVRNANDGISLAQTTEGALQELTNNLQRVRELSVQAANATNSSSDLQALDQEVQQRIAEVNRIATQTSFNGRKVLDGSFGNATFQVGANAGETISVGLSANMKSSAIGQIATTTSADISSLFTSGLTVAAGALTVNTGSGAVTVGSTTVPATYTSAAQLATAINTAAGSTIATVSGSELSISNSSTTNTITFGGSAASTVGLGTVAVATAGAPATSGSYTSGTISAFDYSVAGGAASAGKYQSGTIGGFNFATIPATSGSITSGNIAGFNYSTVAATKGSYDTGTLTSYDFSGTNAVFDVDGTGNTVTLSGNHTVAGLAGVVTELQGQLDTAFTPGTYTATANSGGDGFVITRTSDTAGAASTAVAISNGTGADFTAGAFTAGAGTGGANADTTANKTFTVDSHAITLTANDTDITGLKNDVQTQLDSYGTGVYSVTNSGNALVISKVATGATSTTPAIAGADASFITGGTSTSGADADTTANKTFTVDGNSVTLNANDTDITGLKNDVQAKLDTAAGTGIYSVTNSGNALVISKVATGATSTAPVIGGTDAALITAGGGAGTPGADLVPTTNKSFSVDGHAITLTANDTDITGLKNDVQTKLNAAAAGIYSVTNSGNTLVISKVATGVGSTAPVITGTDATFFTTGGSAVAGANVGTPTATTATSTGVNTAVTAATSLSLGTGDLTVKLGTGAAVDMANTYTSGQALADAINVANSGAYASFDSTAHTLTVSSTSAVTLAGNKAGAVTGGLGFAAGTAAVTTGSMATANVTTAANANLTMLQVDSALTAVSTLRSTLGAIQNRFQSTINSLQSVSENLSASRSRIQDTDFAAETAALTRVQILQQAGVAMVAQANAAPQNVLSLLKG
jgi:flagellin